MLTPLSKWRGAGGEVTSPHYHIDHLFIYHLLFLHHHIIPSPHYHIDHLFIYHLLFLHHHIITSSHYHIDHLFIYHLLFLHHHNIPSPHYHIYHLFIYHLLFLHHHNIPSPHYHIYHLFIYYFFIITSSHYQPLLSKCSPPSPNGEGPGERSHHHTPSYYGAAHRNIYLFITRKCLASPHIGVATYRRLHLVCPSS